MIRLATSQSISALACKVTERVIAPAELPISGAPFDVIVDGDSMEDGLAASPVHPEGPYQSDVVSLTKSVHNRHHPDKN